MGMAQTGAGFQGVAKHTFQQCSATLRRKSMALALLDDGESSNTKFGNSWPGDHSMKKACGKALLILSSFVLALLIMEIVVRVLDLPPQPLAPRPITDFRLSENPVISYEYQPGDKPSDRPFDESHRGFAINSAGFRDYEYAETKPAETYRLAFPILGLSKHSWTFATNTP
jgi:hypothetical protein